MDEGKVEGMCGEGRKKFELGLRLFEKIVRVRGSESDELPGSR